MKSYWDLDVYKESKSLAISIHKMTMALPTFKMFEEGSQIRRSAKAVTSLIVEGYGRRRYKAEFIKYLIYAQSECEETIVHLEFLYETHSLADRNIYELHKSDYDSLSRKINKFIKWVKNNLNDFAHPSKPTTPIT